MSDIIDDALCSWEVRELASSLMRERDSLAAQLAAAVGERDRLAEEASAARRLAHQRRTDYLDVADALLPSSDGPQDLVREVHRMQAELTTLRAALAEQVAAGEEMRGELAEHYAVAITARAMCNDEARIGDLRDIIDAIGNGTPEQRLATLPPRRKATP